MPTVVLVAAAWELARREHGSFEARDWLPYAVLAALVAATVLLSGAALHPPRAALGGLLALVGLAVWAAVSILWTPMPAMARDDSLLTLFYAFVLATPLFTLHGAGERRAAVAVFVAALGILAVAVAWSLRFDHDPLGLYEGGRLYSPITYANGQAAMFVVAFWPALGLAARRATHPTLRALALAAAVAVLGGGLLAQSKGSAVGLAVSAVALFALSPHRLRLLLPTGVALAFVGGAFGALTSPYRASGDLATWESIRHAGGTLLWLTAAALVVGAVYALVDRRLELSPAVRRAAGVLALAVLLLGIAGGFAAFFARVDRPGHFFAEKWQAFKHKSGDATSTHLLSLGSNRYDFWRVALGQFEHHPIAGIGSRGFYPVYVQKRHSDETPLRSHSLPVDVLSEEGIVGFGLLAAGLGLPLAVAVRRRRSVTISATFAAAVYWLAHASVDWIWTLPAVGVPFFLLLGIGAAADRGVRLARRAALPAGALGLLVAFLVFAPPWVSWKFTEKAVDDPARAATDFRWARRLDPLTLDPLIVESQSASSPRAKIPPLERAVDMEPRYPALHYALGLAYLDAGRKADARRELLITLGLDPRDGPSIRSKLAAARP